MEKKRKLFCIPYAGGRAEAFREFASYLPEDITAVPVEYAGHGRRAEEPFYQTFAEMTEDVAAVIESHLSEGEEFAIFGYSMGSVAAYEIAARRLLVRQPEILFLAAHEVPGEEWESKGYSRMDDAAFAKAIVAFGGFDRFEDRFLENRHFRKMIFDPIREDYRLIAEYTWAPAEKLSIPAVLFYAPCDVPLEKAGKWQKRFASRVELIEIGENHFFLRNHARELALQIAERMRRAGEGKD